MKSAAFAWHWSKIKIEMVRWGGTSGYDYLDSTGNGSYRNFL